MSQRAYLRSEEKERFWRKVLHRQAASGMSVREFCRRQALKESAFYFWKRTIAERDGRTKGSGRGPKAAGGGRRGRSAARGQRGGQVASAVATFMPLELVGQTLRLEILAPDGWRVRVPGGFDGRTLGEVVAALRSAAGGEAS